MTLLVCFSDLGDVMYLLFKIECLLSRLTRKMSYFGLPVEFKSSQRGLSTIIL